MLAACGVSIGCSSNAPEFFQGIELEGDLFVNRPLTLSVTVTNAIPMPVRIACYYEDRTVPFAEERNLTLMERGLLIGERLLEPSEDADAATDAQQRTLSFTFSVPDPGIYDAGCTTPAAPENIVKLEFELRAAIDSVAQLR